jgi:hypothetical protein
MPSAVCRKSAHLSKELSAKMIHHSIKRLGESRKRASLQITLQKALRSAQTSKKDLPIP